MLSVQGEELERGAGGCGGGCEGVGAQCLDWENAVVVQCLAAHAEKREEK